MKTKIKIAHILHSVGGVDVSLRTILENVDPEKIENVVIHGNNDMSINFVDKNKNVLKEYPLSINREISLINDFKAIYNTYKIIKREKPDLIHAHSAKGGLIGRLIGKILNINVLFTPQAFSYLSSESKIKTKIYQILEKITKFDNSYLLASSNSELQRGLNEIGYSKNKAILFNNSIKPITQIYNLSIERTWPDQYICTVGRPSYQKNIELMLDVLSEINKKQNLHLVLMGIGFHQDKLQSVLSKIKILGLEDKVTLLNWTSRSDIFHIIKNSKLYISTARYEGLPYAMIESLALAKPCVVSDCDGNRDLVINDYNGFVIRTNDPKDFSESILQLLNNELIFNSFSENALNRFNNNFNIDTNISILQDIYSKYAKC